MIHKSKKQNKRQKNLVLHHIKQTETLNYYMSEAVGLKKDNLFICKLYIYLYRAARCRSV